MEMNNSIQKVDKKHFLNNEDWFKALTKHCKKCEVVNDSRVTFFYKNEEYRAEAIKEAEDRNILISKDLYYNKDIKAYSFEILCWPGNLIPRQKRT